MSRLERRARIETLREDVMAGRYRVPATDVATSLLRHLGLAWACRPEALFQQR